MVELVGRCCVEYVCESVCRSPGRSEEFLDQALPVQPASCGIEMPTDTISAHPDRADVQFGVSEDEHRDVCAINVLRALGRDRLDDRETKRGREPALVPTGWIPRLEKATAQVDGSGSDLERRNHVGKMRDPIDHRLEQAHPELARRERGIVTVVGDDVLLSSTHLDTPNGVLHGVHQAGGKAEEVGDCRGCGDRAFRWEHALQHSC